MGDNLYIDYWQTVLPTIIAQFKAGNQTVQLEVKGLEQFGERKSYYANFRIVNGSLEIPKNAYAQGRDLHQVLLANDYFRENLANSTIQVTITKSLELKMEILENSAPDFFTEEDFEQLAKFEKERLAEDNAEHKITYEILKGSYNKVEYWAKQVLGKLFKEGVVNLRKRPTNQASRFESYQWAKIYPNKQAAAAVLLAYTVTIDTDEQFVVKIDTVGLNENDERRQKYLEVRGDYYKSAIVKILPADQVLDKGWKHLIDLTATIITNLKPAFESLQSALNGLSSKSDSASNSSVSAIPLNTILYGPPGTGKTYNTINKAIAIANPTFEIEKATRLELKAEYERLTSEGQIAFITFHQSMSYEDFIEGIKPDISKGEKEISYVIEDGIFKRLCKKAYQEASVEDNFAEAYSKLLQEIEENDNALVLKTLKREKEFTIYENSKRNLRFHANTEKAYEGVITQDYIRTYLQTGELADWPSYTKAVGEYLRANFGYKSLQKSNERNYVLIIDEINRGNVSQIFGELITLIEDDKRFGKNEALAVTLPYSKASFCVPSNLYIVGTMNTADRSVEALDTALRRRFVFEPMLPEEQLLSSQRIIARFFDKYHDYEWEDEEYRHAASNLYNLLGIDPSFEKNVRQDVDTEMADEDKVMALSNDLFKGLNFQKLLTTINHRLETLLSKDHTIGHAWLMNVYSLEDLQGAFKHKILPILQEFFYNDYVKIGLVLGKYFVEARPAGSPFANFDEELASEYVDKTIYNLKDPFVLSTEDFISIYQ